MHTRMKPTGLPLWIVLVMGFIAFAGCVREQPPLIVYAGKGLRNTMEKIRQDFEEKHGIPVSIIYAGSDTLLTTIQKSKKGDIFIPGSAPYIAELREQVTTIRPVAKHMPAFLVRADNPKRLRTFTDLMAAGVKIAVGNKDMCAIGMVAETIIAASEQPETFRRNIVVTGSTVNELLNLVVTGEVDAALAWEDMQQWPEATGLQPVAIPDAINAPEEIQIAILASSANPKQAALFVDFVATEGKASFAKHGFRVE